MLDDVTGSKQDSLCDLPPRWRAPQQELEIHAEVLELLSLRVTHHGERLGIGLDRDALLVPADRLGLLSKRGAQACECPRGGRELVRWLVVLVKAHRISLKCGVVRSAPSAYWAPCRAAMTNHACGS